MINITTYHYELSAESRTFDECVRRICAPRTTGTIGREHRNWAQPGFVSPHRTILTPLGSWGLGATFLTIMEVFQPPKMGIYIYGTIMGYNQMIFGYIWVYAKKGVYPKTWLFRSREHDD